MSLTKARKFYFNVKNIYHIKKHAYMIILRMNFRLKTSYISYKFCSLLSDSWIYAYRTGAYAILNIVNSELYWFS